MIYDTPTKAENYLAKRKIIYLSRYTRGGGRLNENRCIETKYTYAFITALNFASFTYIQLIYFQLKCLKQFYVCEQHLMYVRCITHRSAHQKKK